MPACHRGTDRRREVDHTAYLAGNGDLVWTADRPGVPIQGKRRLRKAAAVAHQPGLAIDGQLWGPLVDKPTTEVASINIQFEQLAPWLCKSAIIT